MDLENNNGKAKLNESKDKTRNLDNSDRKKLKSILKDNQQPNQNTEENVKPFKVAAEINKNEKPVKVEVVTMEEGLNAIVSPKKSRSIFASPTNKLSSDSVVNHTDYRPEQLQAYTEELDSSIKQSTNDLRNVKSPLRNNIKIDLKKKIQPISDVKQIEVQESIPKDTDSIPVATDELIIKDEKKSNNESYLSSTYIPTLLYVDILRFADLIFLSNKPWHVKKAFDRVLVFVESAKELGITLKCFLDNYSSGLGYGTLQNYKNEVVKDFNLNQKELPENVVQLLGEMFTKCGVEVVYRASGNEVSLTAVIVSHALATNADILSSNRDLFNYQSIISNNKSVKVFKGYTIKSKESYELTLLPFNFQRDNESEVKIPDVSIPIEVSKHFSGFIQNNHFLRGIATPILKSLLPSNNPYNVVTPLRNTFYYLAGVSGPVKEEWFVWEGDEGKWHVEEEIYPLANTVKDLDLYVRYFYYTIIICLLHIIYHYY